MNNKNIKELKRLVDEGQDLFDIPDPQLFEGARGVKLAIDYLLGYGLERGITLLTRYYNSVEDVNESEANVYAQAVENLRRIRRGF